MSQLKKAALILIIIALTLLILVKGKPILVPFVLAGLLATLLLPIVEWLGKKGFNKALSILSSMMILVIFFAGVIALLSWQIADLASDAPQIEKQLSEKYQDLREYISETFNISEEKQDEMIDKQKDSTSGKTSGMVTGIIGGLGGMLTDIILALVYIFLLLYYRGHLKRFIIRLVPEEKKNVAQIIVQDSAKVAQQYLTGLSLMILVLWIMYGIGFTLVGVKSPIFFAVLCGLLEIIPFIGNVIGTTLTVLVTVMQGGDTNVIIGILITYGFVQFIQTYILEPLVVGAEVNINPLFTVLALVVGEIIWGLPGMVLAIPLMGVTKIICDHIEPLKPFGELIGSDKKKGESGFKKKIKSLKEKIGGMLTSS